MGCHTWFYRPLTNEEFDLMSSYALSDIEEVTGATEENIKAGMYDESLYDCLIESYRENKPCVYGKYWWELGYGSIGAFGNCSVHCIKGKLYMEIEGYHDTFRVYNYPKWIIHNRKELRRKMRSKYFELSDEQIERISEFFRKYKDGIITFG